MQSRNIVGCSIKCHTSWSVKQDIPLEYKKKLKKRFGEVLENIFFYLFLLQKWLTTKSLDLPI